MSLASSKVLHVLFDLPKENISPENIVLSFLTPDKEQKFIKPFKGRLFIGRLEMNRIREKTRLFYIDLVARIGATPCHGKTLRQYLHQPNAGNPWWYHPFTAKSCEHDQMFNRLLQIFTIIQIYEQGNNQFLVLHGGSQEVANVLYGTFPLIKKGKLYHDRPFLLRSLLSRIKFFLKTIQYHIVLKRHNQLPEFNPDIVFHGFWDWSVQFTKQKTLKDTYFTNLPNHLTSKNFKCAWLLWFEPHHKLGSEGRSLKSVLKLVKNHSQLILVQRFLKIVDILWAFVDFRPLYQYYLFSRSKEFKNIFKENNVNFQRLVHRYLIYNFFGASLPLLKLVEISHRRAFARYSPKVALTFQELFLNTRPFYQGGRLGYPETVFCAVQHCSYNREKTFNIIEPKREFQGNPDGFAMPTPDYIFALGELGKKIFIENGFPPNQVFLTGTPKYNHIKLSCKNKIINSENRHFNVLLTPTLNLLLELEMVEAAILASSELDNINLYLRSHPSARMEELPEIQPLLPYLTSTTGTLEEDLNIADLVLFTYSSVAEEAFLRGIPVWQWLPAGFNGSVFREISVVPKFSQVENLNNALFQFVKNPNSFLPSKENQRLVLDQCFYKEDGKATQRIAKHILEIVRSKTKMESVLVD